MNGRSLHRGATIVLSVVLALIGVVMIVRTLTGGGGPAAYGVVVGICFLAAGCARLWLALRGPR